MELDAEFGTQGSDQTDLTQLLARFRLGDPQAAESLIPIVYHSLRQIAASRLRSERPDHTLQPTELVHEVFIRLFGNQTIEWQDRLHFFIVASNQMRRLLVDYARARNADKRHGGLHQVELSDDHGHKKTPVAPIDVLALDQALNALAEDFPRCAQVIELRYFGGLTEKEAADALDISISTLKRDWEFARAFLYRYLKSTRNT